MHRVATLDRVFLPALVCLVGGHQVDHASLQIARRALISLALASV